MLKRPVALVGMPGSGKSTIGKALAEEIGCPFIDSDDLIEKEAGCKISEIFEKDGEPVFRDMEKSTITGLLDHEPAPYILSTGGGAVMAPDVHAALFEKSILIYLSVSVEGLWQRLENTYVNRPLLNQEEENPKQRLYDLMEKREETYKKAHIIIDCDEKALEDIVEETIRKIAS